MIIFYSRYTGEIAGSINARIHPEEHFKMWIGSKEDNLRIVIQWKAVRWFDKDGNEVPESESAFAADFEPDVDDPKQKQIIENIDAGKDKTRNYRVDTVTQKLVKKGT